MVKTSKKMFVPRHITQKILGLLEEFNYVKSKVPAYKCLCYLYDKSIKKFRKRALEISVLFFSVLNEKLEKIWLHPIQYFSRGHSRNKAHLLFIPVANRLFF